jgi:large subunit ribosomal protein L35
MPKLKSNRASMKRYRFTANGTARAARAGRRHNLHQKNEKRKRTMRRASLLPDVMTKKVHRTLPYGSR